MIKGNNFDWNILRLMCASPKIKTGDIAGNTDKVIQIINEADKSKVSALFFPEMTLVGVDAKDILFNNAFLPAQKKAIEKICRATKHTNMLISLGIVVCENYQLMKDYLLIQNGAVVGNLYDKNLSSEQAKYLTCDCPWADLVADPANRTFGLSDNADIQIFSSSKKIHLGYVDFVTDYVKTKSSVNHNVAVFTAENGLMVIAECGKIVAVSDPFAGSDAIAYDVDMDVVAHEKITANRRDLVGISGLNDSSISADSYPVEGIGELRGWDGVSTLIRDVRSNPFEPASKAELYKNCRDIFNIQAHELAQRLKDTYSKVSVVGISGGLDSTLALLVTAYAHKLSGRKPEDIIAVTMPGFGTTDRTYDNAVKMIKSTGATFKEISIVPAVTQHFKDIEHDLEDRTTTYENAQARERTQILMDISNKYGGIVVGTGDLSENALGWCTYNGDHMSMFGVNGDVPKTVIKRVVEWFVAEELPVIDYVSDKEILAECLIDVVNTPISPELLPPDENGEIAQRTEDKVGPYELHDFFIYYTVRYGTEPEKLLKLAEYAFKDQYDKEFIHKWLTVFYKRFFSQQFKRNAAPDSVVVGSIDITPANYKMTSTTAATMCLNQL